MGFASDITFTHADGFVLVQDSRNNYNYQGAFTLDDGGMLETVDFDKQGRPEWDNAGYCDRVRGSDPELQDRVEKMLFKNAKTLDIAPHKLLHHITG